MMRTYRKIIAWLLTLTCLLGLVGCAKKNPDPTGTTAPVQTTAPAEIETTAPAAAVLEGVTLETAAGLAEVTREDTEAGMTLTSSNAAGDMEAIRLNKTFDTVYGRYYEAVYRFTSNVAGKVRFTAEGAAYYGTNEYEVAAGENEITVRFAAGKNSTASLELGGLDKFELTFTEISCRELKADLSKYFLDVADKASGTMEMNGDGHLAASFKADEGWRVKLAVDRSLVAGKTYETTFVFTKEGGKPQNVTYTVYDGAATILGSRTKWVDGDVCVATFYLTANESITKGTCLELGQLCGGEEVSMTFTYVDFVEVGAEKLAQLKQNNPFPGVGAWTEGALAPAVAEQSAEGLRLTNPNDPTDWWKVKLEMDLKGEKDHYYRVTFVFDSDATGKIKFVNDGASYVTANEYNVKKGSNTFSVDLKHGGNSYSCLELGGLGKCELNFTDIKVEEIEKPKEKPVVVNPLAGFRVWTDESVQPLTRHNEAHAITLESENEPTDWWKIKLEKDIKGKAGRCYEVVYTFTTSAAGRIKFVNDDAVYFTPNEYDVQPGENTFAVQFKYGGKPYSCLELGGLGKFTLVLTDYTIKRIDEPEVISNGFENYKGWTEGSMTPLNREDTETSMILTSTNAPGDWWKVKLENNFALEPGKTYEAAYTFTSDATGDIKFGTNENVACHTADVYHVTAGTNQFKVAFTAQEGAYTCLELGGLGQFRLEFTAITLTETEAPEQPPEHTHSFVNGLCECGETNGFTAFQVWTEGSLTPVVREDTENSMTLISTNGYADWWKVKLEWPLNITEGKTYDATFRFTSDATGTIKYSVNGASNVAGNEYNVQSGSNTFTVRFTAGAENYSCLELGGLGAFKLTFTGISLTEVAEEHVHSFVNGRCDCGKTNGFAGVSVWTEGSLTPLVREDSENSMTLISTNGYADWWKVKLEWPLNITEGKTYEVTFRFTSDATGTIKYSVNGASNVVGNEYNVQSGSNTFTIRFTAGAENYSCLELGGLGAFKLTFTGIGIQEVS